MQALGRAGVGNQTLAFPGAVVASGKRGGKGIKISARWVSSVFPGSFEGRSETGGWLGVRRLVGWGEAWG